MTQFTLSGQLEALYEAISFLQEALNVQPIPHLLRPSSLNNLAIALKKRFDQSGQREDLDEASNVRYVSLDALPSEHPDICTISSNLGTTLLMASLKKQYI